jgi:rhodanese-related sulfurtransferase
MKGARLIPVTQIEDRLSEIAKDKPILLYCASGARSQAAMDELRENGYTQVSHMVGGFEAWKDAGKSFEK